jgi:rhodanese-related sulfurtransferase
LEAVQVGKLPEVPKERPIYLICERGLVSELVGLYLEAAGFEHVFNVEGGMQALRSSINHPQHQTPNEREK